MSSIAVAFWGAFFGSVTLSFVAALLAFRRSARRVALTGAVAAVLSGFYVLVFLGWVPIDDRATLLRVQAQTAVASAAVLGLLLFALLGFRNPATMKRITAGMGALTAAVLGAGWLQSPVGALNTAIVMEAVVIAAALLGAVGSASRGERAGWLALTALPCMSLAVAGLGWYALNPHRTSTELHAASAVAAIGYLLSMATAMWTRYSYLIEVSEVMSHGPNFDPVTRLPSHQEIRNILTNAHGAGEGRLCGIIAITVGNLKMLEQLHGRAAFNHALFVSGSRLRRLALPGVVLMRLSDDGFLMVVRSPRDAQQLIAIADQVVQRLSRPLALGTSDDINEIEKSKSAWRAEVGVGLLMAHPDMKPDQVVARARAVSFTARSYASRIAWYDESAEEISELPADEAASTGRLKDRMARAMGDAF